MEKVYIIDTDSAVRDALTTLLESFDLPVEAYSDSDSFLQAVSTSPTGCVLVEAEMPGMPQGAFRWGRFG